MRRLLEGCAATVLWMRGTAKLDAKDADYKSDSLVVVGADADADGGDGVKAKQEKDKELALEELQRIKEGAVTLRAAVCELIAENQQWLTVVGEAVQRREEFED